VLIVGRQAGKTKLASVIADIEAACGSSGRDRVDHRPGATDDRANAAAGVADLLLGQPQNGRGADFVEII